MNAFFPRTFLKDCPVVESAAGVWLQDRDGKRYFDGSCGAIVTNLGHGNARINDAILKQLNKVAYAHTSQFWSEPALKLCEKLIELAPANFTGGRVFLTSGGSESVETALKMARGFFLERGESNRHQVISRRHSYHGATAGALSVTGHPARKRPYSPILKESNFIHSTYDYRCLCGDPSPTPCKKQSCALARANELEEAILELGPENVMAFLAEPISGAALGAVVPGDAYWPRIKDICTKYGVLLIADEVMVGLGRTGKVFAINHWQVEPDLIVLGKGLAAGYQPLGAVLAGPKVVDAFQKNSGIFEHGYTYSGHPVAAAAGLACLEFLARENLVERVAEMQTFFFSKLEELRKYEFVGDIRGRGLFAGIEFVEDKQSKKPFDAAHKFSKKISAAATANGVLIYPGSAFIDGVSGDHVLIAPPFIATKAEMDEMFDRLDAAFSSVQTIQRS
ncbi:MAG: aspartate aminotransferase family protein [Cyanobacteriota/Melainabacteria group bacterium]